jgi:hypothetical protein
MEAIVKRCLENEDWENRRKWRLGSDKQKSCIEITHIFLLHYLARIPSAGNFI